jgi:hypothetical protein
MTGAIVLSRRWIFWFRQQRAPGNKLVSYEEGIKKISAFSSVSFQSKFMGFSPDLIYDASARSTSSGLCIRI